MVVKNLERFKVDINYDIYPTVYLKSNVKISGGDGSPSNPYVFE